MNQNEISGLFEIIRLQNASIDSLLDVSDDLQKRVSKAEQRIAFLEAMMYEKEHEFQFGESEIYTLQ